MTPALKLAIEAAAKEYAGQGNYRVVEGLIALISRHIAPHVGVVPEVIRQAAAKYARAFPDETQWYAELHNALADATNTKARIAASAFQKQPSPLVGEGWIACSERMPEEGKYVYARSHLGDNIEASLEHDHWRDRSGTNRYKEFFTHWHALPSFPPAPDAIDKALDAFGAEGAKAWADVPDSAAWVRELRDGKQPEPAKVEISDEEKIEICPWLDSLKSTPDATVCEHGRLARKCDTCDLIEANETLEAINKVMRDLGHGHELQDDLAASVRSVIQRLHNYCADHSELQQKVDAMGQDIASLKADIAEKDAEIAKWRKARDECERQFQEKVVEISNAEAMIYKLTLDRNEAGTAISQVARERDCALRRAENAEANLRSAQVQLACYPDAVMARHAVVRLDDEVKRLKADNTGTMNLLNAAIQRAEAAEKEINGTGGWKEMCRDFVFQVASLKASLVKYEAVVEAITRCHIAQSRSLESALAALNKEAK